MWLAALAALALASVASGTVLPSGASGGAGLELIILHNNDMHARFEQTSQLSGVCTPLERDAGKCYGGFPRVAHVVKKMRAAALDHSGPPVLYLNAGDTYTGTAWFSLYKWKIAVDFLNALHPDAVSLGNHEFDLNIQGLTPFVENLNSPILAANLILDKVPTLQVEPNLMKSIVIDVNGFKVGIIGYLTPDTKFLAQKNDVQYIDEVVALREEVKNLQNKGIKILIALGHSGFTKDLEIGREVDGIDLVIGGHTNTFLWNGTSPDAEKIDGPYPTMVKQKSGRLVPVVQAYAYTKYLGQLHIKFDEDGEIVSFDGSPILLDKTIPQDPEVLAIVNLYKSNVTRLAEEVVGNTSVILDGTDCRLHECNIANLITDAIVYERALEYNGDRWTDSPIAIIQGGGVRGSIAPPVRPGPITRGDALTVLPFESHITAVTMNGTVLRQALEHSVSNYNPLSAPGKFLQYSGIRVIFDLARPSGSRLVSVVARCWECAVPAYYDVEDWRSYKVLMPVFLSEGGDGFTMFEGLPAEQYEYDELSCLINYLARRSPVYPEIQERITLLNQDAIEGFVEENTYSGSVRTMVVPSIILVLFSSVISKL